MTLCGGEKLNFSLDSACFSAEVAVKVDMCCLCFVFLHVKLLSKLSSCCHDIRKVMWSDITSLLWLQVL